VLLLLLGSSTISWQSERVEQQGQSGLSSAKLINKFLLKNDFLSLIPKVTDISAHMFRVAATGFDKNLPEAQLIKRAFENLLNNLEHFPPEFDEVIRRIDWGVVQSAFQQNEFRIRSMTQTLRRMISSNQNEAQEFKNRFIREYENSVGSHERLVAEIIAQGNGLNSNIIEHAKRYTENHRHDVQDFMVGLLKLILQGIQIEASYNQLKYGNQELLQYMQSFWNNRMVTVRDVMQRADSSLQNGWYAQFNIDVENYANRNQHMNNPDFAANLYTYLRDKYRWREWFVIAYNPVSGWDAHATIACESKHQLRIAGRNIFASSIEIGRSAWNQDVIQRELNDIRSVQGRSYRGGDFARQILDQFGPLKCEQTRAIGVIQWGAGSSFIANSNHATWAGICVRHCPDPACWFPRNLCYLIFKTG